MSGSKSDRTEAASPRRKREARREGRVAKSPELVTWGSVLAGSMLAPLTVATAGRQLRQLFAHAATIAADPSSGAALHLLGEGTRAAAVTLAPLVAGLAALGIAGNLAQVGFTPATKALKPKLSRLSPLPGLKRLTSPATLWEAGKALVKLVILGELARRSLMSAVPRLTGSALPLDTLAATTAATVLHFVRNVALAGLVLAAADYAVQRRRVGTNLKMTKQEVKEESRMSEGSPQIKGAIRARQFRLSRQRMMTAVAGADAVVVNPTHYAVALRYEPARGAPRVVAKGVDAIAARIREEADLHRVPLIADPPLARTLYAACDLDQEVPATLYEAVAKVLAFVFALKARGTPLPGTHRLPTAPAARPG